MNGVYPSRLIPDFRLDCSTLISLDSSLAESRKFVVTPKSVPIEDIICNTKSSIQSLTQKVDEYYKYEASRTL